MFSLAVKQCKMKQLLPLAPKTDFSCHFLQVLLIFLLFHPFEALAGTSGEISWKTIWGFNVTTLPSYFSFKSWSRMTFLCAFPFLCKGCHPSSILGGKERISASFSSGPLLTSVPFKLSSSQTRPVPDIGDQPFSFSNLFPDPSLSGPSWPPFTSASVNQTARSSSSCSFTSFSFAWIWGKSGQSLHPFFWHCQDLGSAYYCKCSLKLGTLLTQSI